MSEKTITQTESVYKVTARILSQLASDLESSQSKAILSGLRNSISKPYTNSIEVFSLVYQYLPESFINNYGQMSFEEKAILTSLQLYAIHQQGISQSVLVDSEDDRYENMGYFLKSLRLDDNAKSSDRRFNTLITSDTFEEFTFHLRQLINLLKSRTDVKVNYAKLAQDLYFFQIHDTREKIKLSWAKEYYRYVNKENKGEENE